MIEVDRELVRAQAHNVEQKIAEALRNKEITNIPEELNELFDLRNHLRCLL